MSEDGVRLALITVFGNVKVGGPKSIEQLTSAYAGDEIMQTSKQSKFLLIMCILL